MNDKISFGRKISSKEYTQRVFEANGFGESRVSRSPHEVGKEEMNAMIDRQLGIDFPSERRAAVLAVWAKEDRRHLWRIFKGVASKPWAPLAGVYAVTVRAYSRVLSKKEVDALFGLDGK